VRVYERPTREVNDSLFDLFIPCVPYAPADGRLTSPPVVDEGGCKLVTADSIEGDLDPIR
jgi:hypothetical protein